MCASSILAGGIKSPGNRRLPRGCDGACSSVCSPPVKASLHATAAPRPPRSLSKPGLSPAIRDAIALHLRLRLIQPLAETVSSVAAAAYRDADAIAAATSHTSACRSRTGSQVDRTWGLLDGSDRPRRSGALGLERRRDSGTRPFSRRRSTPPRCQPFEPGLARMGGQRAVASRPGATRRFLGFRNSAVALGVDRNCVGGLPSTSSGHGNADGLGCPGGQSRERAGLRERVQIEFNLGAVTPTAFDSFAVRREAVAVIHVDPLRRFFERIAGGRASPGDRNTTAADALRPASVESFGAPRKSDLFCESKPDANPDLRTVIGPGRHTANYEGRTKECWAAAATRLARRVGPRQEFRRGNGTPGCFDLGCGGGRRSVIATRSKSQCGGERHRQHGGPLRRRHVF
jgi:hypothetical protein